MLLKASFKNYNYYYYYFFAKLGREQAPLRAAEMHFRC